MTSLYLSVLIYVTGAEDCESDQDSVDSYHTATDTSDEEEGLFEDSFDSTDGKTSPCVSFVYGYVKKSFFS